MGLQVKGPVPTSTSCSEPLPGCCPGTPQPSQHPLLVREVRRRTGSQK